MNPGMGWALVGIAVILILGFDAWLVMNKKPSMTKSFMRAIVVRPFIPFLLGFGIGYLSGHLTWPGEDCFRSIIEEVLR